MMSKSTDVESTASAPDFDQSEEHQCCRDQYSTFLDLLSDQLRREAKTFLHDLSKVDSDVVGAKEKFDNLILRIEAELGQEHMICELITKLIAEALRKLHMLEDAIELVKGRMERFGTEDFGSLLTLSGLYNCSGDYNKPLIPTKKCLQLAKQKGDPVLQSLALAKLSVIHWHLQDPEESQNELQNSLHVLKHSNVEASEIRYPMCDNSHRLLDLYKTIGYIYRLNKNSMQSAHYYQEALKIVEQDDKAVIQLLKLETQVGRELSVGPQKNKTKEYCWRAYHRIKKISKNEVFMTHHPLPIIHSLSRIAYSMKIAERDHVLELREFLFNVGEKYLPEYHPEVARISADCAFSCSCLFQHSKEAFYVEKAEAILAHNRNETDTDFVKAHVREISDAWDHLGKSYSRSGNLTEAERCFKESIAMNIRVYGMNHPRLIPLYLSLGDLYKKQKKYNEAFSSLRKSWKILAEFQPDNFQRLQNIKGKMQLMKELDKRTGTGIEDD